MKRAGLIGGVSWHSTMDIYRDVNQYVASEKGENNCAKLILDNLNLSDILNAEKRTSKEDIITASAKRLQLAGADFIALCSNGLHQFADEITQAVNIPFIHIAESTADEILRNGYRKVGLLGVLETMEQSFYKEKLIKKGLSVLIPEKEERVFIDRVLFEETGKGIVKEQSSKKFYEISESLAARGADCVILGCTEIGMLMQQEYTNIPLFDTAKIHAETIGRLCCLDN
ncbi:MAG: amino acid racemase [Emergencia sp.]|nr:amino acid racemase [Emergencia sp.]